MSDASAEQYHPGLEGVIASETAIANIEERDGPGVSSIAATGSRTSPAMSLRGDGVPAPARRPARAAPASRVRRSAAAARGRFPSRWSTLLGQIPPHVHPMDVLRTLGERAGPFRPRTSTRPPTDHAANVRKAERMIAQMATAVASASGSPPGCRRSRPRRPRPRRQFPPHGQRQGPVRDDARGVRPLAGPLHRARARTRRPSRPG